jgi:hypothetical protein
MNHNLFQFIYNDFKVFNILLFYSCFLAFYSKQNLKKEKKYNYHIYSIFDQKETKITDLTTKLFVLLLIKKNAFQKQNIPPKTLYLPPVILPLQFKNLYHENRN